jgi:hypothetical protein
VVVHRYGLLGFGFKNAYLSKMLIFLKESSKFSLSFDETLANLRLAY